MKAGSPLVPLAVPATWSEYLAALSSVAAVLPGSTTSVSQKTQVMHDKMAKQYAHNISAEPW